MDTTFILRCLTCGWTCRIESGDIEQARLKAYTLHRQESRVRHPDGSVSICAGETVEVRWHEKGHEATYFVTCPACDWSSPVKAAGPIEALKAGAARHAAECPACARKAMEVDHDGIEGKLSVKIFG